MSLEQPPNAMRALLYSQPAQTLKLYDSWPVPEPDFTEDEHLLKVHSTAITKGELLWRFPPECYKDYSPGVEMSGIVIASPSGSDFPPGTNVYMRTTSPRSASAREYTIGLGKELAVRPQNFTAEQAASVPVSALTAWQALFVQAKLPPLTCDLPMPSHDQYKKHVLIIGASGSVGLWTTQLARAAGFWVAGTCHTRNINILQDFGAHEIIDYTKTSIRKWLENSNSMGKFDLVLDCVGGTGSDNIRHAAKPDHGLVLSIVGPKDGVLKWDLDRPDGINHNVKGRFFIMESIGAQLQEITTLIEAGKLQTVVDSVFDLEDYQTAFDRVDSGKTTGKVVIRVQRE